MIFQNTDFLDISPEQVQVRAGEIRQRFDMRRNIYHHIRNNSPLSVATWVDFDRAMINFETEYNMWTMDWSAAHQSNEIAFLTSHFNSGNAIFQKIESIIEQNGIIASIDLGEFKRFQSYIQADIHTKFSDLTHLVESKISEGISNLLSLKGELELTKNFDEKIKSKVKSSNFGSWAFFTAFLVSIIGYGCLITLPFAIDPLKSLNSWEQIGIRVSISIPAGIIILFIYNQYRFYKLSHSKYEHLDIFLGGGISSLQSILGANEDLKIEINKKISDQFVNVDDLVRPILSKSTPYPLDIKDINKALSELTKTVESLKGITSNKIG